MRKSAKKLYQVYNYLSDTHCIFWRCEDKNTHLEYIQEKDGSFKNKPNRRHCYWLTSFILTVLET